MRQARRGFVVLNTLLSLAAIAVVAVPKADASGQVCEQDMRCVSNFHCEFYVGEICCPYWPSQCF